MAQDDTVTFEYNHAPISAFTYTRPNKKRRI